MKQQGSAKIIEKPSDEPKTQTSSSGSLNGSKVKSPPQTPYKRRKWKVGDKIRTPDGKLGVILQIRKNGHKNYLVNVSTVGKKWYSEYEL